MYPYSIWENVLNFQMDKIWNDKERYFGRLFAIVINHERTHNISSRENIRVKLKKKDPRKTKDGKSVVQME